MIIKSASKTAYDTDNLDVVTYVKNLLEYGDDSWRSVAKKNRLWNLDTNKTTGNTNIGFEARTLLIQTANNDGTGDSKDVSGVIPLNWYSFFEELENKMLPPMQLQIHVQLQHDYELSHMAQGRDFGRVVFNFFCFIGSENHSKRQSV